MQVTLQEIYAFVGYAGLGLAAVFAVCAIVYFFRADIRAVRADLSGKTRQAGMAEHVAAPKRARGARGLLVQEGEWQGEISHGSLDEASGSDALTDEQSQSGSSGSGFSGPNRMPASTPLPAQVTRQASGATANGYPYGQAPAGPAQQAASANQAGQVAAFVPSASQAPFAIVRSCVVVHSESVVAPGGGEVPFNVAANAQRG